MAEGERIDRAQAMGRLEEDGRRDKGVLYRIMLGECMYSRQVWVLMLFGRPPPVYCREFGWVMSDAPKTSLSSLHAL